MRKTNWDKYYENLKQNSNTKAELEKASQAIDIAIQIYNLRKKRGFTQKALADMVGIKQSNVARLENVDYRGYSLRTLEKIATALNTNLSVSFIPNKVFLQNQDFVISYITSQTRSKESSIIPDINSQFENAIVKSEQMPEEKYSWNIL